MLVLINEQDMKESGNKMAAKKKSQISKTLLVREMENEAVFTKKVGVGTLVENVLTRFGVTQERFKSAFNLDECGCEERKEWLNKFVVNYHEDKLGLRK